MIFFVLSLVVLCNLGVIENKSVTSKEMLIKVRNVRDVNSETDENIISQQIELINSVTETNLEETTMNPIESVTENIEPPLLVVNTELIQDESTDERIRDEETTKFKTFNVVQRATNTGNVEPTEHNVVEPKTEINTENLHKDSEAGNIPPEDNVTSTAATFETTEVDVSLICVVCECKDRAVDCSNRHLREPFEMPDWDGLENFRPLSVDLSQNPFTTLTRISNVSSLQHLNISNCRIESIEPATFSYLKNLISLDLSGNMLATSSINKRAFVGILDQKLGILPYPNLRYLSLAKNDLHSLSQDIFAFMPEITKLDLSGNPLGYIDQVTMGAIADLENLKELNLSGCELESLPVGMFRRHNRLKYLDLSNNKLTTVPVALGEAVRLENLDFGRNLVESFNGTSPISNLKKLKELRLSRLSKLHTIKDEALGGLENLEVLDLSFNPRLTNLEDGFLIWTDDHTEQEKWPQLRELYLNNNNLSRMYSGYLERWDILIRVDLGNNPYQCDCSNQWIVDVFVPLIRASPSNSTLGNMICKKPKEMKGISFTQLNNASKELACSDPQELTLPVPDMAIILGIIIGIFVTFPLVLVVILLWRKGFFARCRSRRIESESEDEEQNDAFVKLNTLKSDSRIKSQIK